MPRKDTLSPGQTIRACPQCGVTFVRWRCSPVVYCSRACYFETITVPVADRFWTKVDRSAGPDGCWLWTGALASSGYGNVGVQRRPGLAHRVAWELTHGPIPKGMYVCHNCPGGDNKLCVNPAHLWLGTPTQNAQDAWDKGAMPHTHRVSEAQRGSAHHHAKLTEEAVVAIRRAYAAGGVSQSELAARYGVGPGAIQKVIAGTRWRHVDPSSS